MYSTPMHVCVRNSKNYDVRVKLHRVLTTVAIVIISFSANGQNINRFAGNGSSGFSGDSGIATAATFRNPGHAVADNRGNVYISDYYNHRVRKVNSSGIISTFAGTGVAGFSGDGGLATAAELNYPNGITIDNYGNLLITDQSNDRVRKVDTFGIITTIAGDGSSSSSGDGGAATAASLYWPTGAIVDKHGNIFIAEYRGHRVRKVDTMGIITTIAGTGSAGFSGDGGNATAAQLNQSGHVSIDTSGNIYIIDQSNHRVRKINSAGIISTIAGTGSFGYSGDGGPATAAQLYYPSETKLDSRGNLYISDAYNYVVRMITPAGIISTVVGTNVAGFTGDGGAATACTMRQSWGIDIDDCDNLYVCDAQNNVVRVVSYFAGMPPIAGIDSVAVGSSTTLSNAISGGTWSTLNAAVVSVNRGTGQVTGISSGATKIIYTTHCGIDTFNFKVVIPEEQTGIPHAELGSYIHFFPNPTNGTFTVEGSFDNNASRINIEIYDVLGKTVYAINLEDLTYFTQKNDLSNVLNNGTYIMKCTTNDAVQFSKIHVVK